MDSPKVNSSDEALNWFSSLTPEEKQEVIFKMKNLIIARNKKIPDKAYFIMDGDNVKMMVMNEKSKSK